MSATASSSGASSAMWWPESIEWPPRKPVDCSEVGPAGRQDEERAGDALPRGRVGLFVRTVDADAGAVVLKHRRHRSGIVDRAMELSAYASSPARSFRDMDT